MEHDKMKSLANFQHNKMMEERKDGGPGSGPRPGGGLRKISALGSEEPESSASLSEIVRGHEKKQTPKERKKEIEFFFGKTHKKNK